MPEASLTLILIIVGVSIGTSQDDQSLNLTQNNDIICENDLVEFACVLENVAVQWIVEPFINASGFSVFVLTNRNETLNTIVRDGPLQIRHTSTDPFTTVLTINSSIIPNNTEIVCLIFPNGYREQITYVAMDRMILPVNNVITVGIADESIIAVSWLPSPSPNIVRYVINCTGDGTCENAVINCTGDGRCENRVTLKVNIPATTNREVLYYTVSIIAENICGMQSVMKVANAEIGTRSGNGTDSEVKVDVGLIVGLSVSGIVLVGVGTTATGASFYFYYKKNKKSDSSEQTLADSGSDGQELERRDSDKHKLKQPVASM